MGVLVGPALRAGRVQLTGRVPNGQHFDANPVLIWFVTSSRAIVEGHDLGETGPLAEQAHFAGFYLPQRGIFATGCWFGTPPRDTSTVDTEANTDRQKHDADK